MSHDDIATWTKMGIDAGLPGDLVRRLVGKMVDGVKKYGKWDPALDDRNYRLEILEELYDSMNYAIMGMLSSNEEQKRQFTSLLVELAVIADQLRR